MLGGLYSSISLFHISSYAQEKESGSIDNSYQRQLLKGESKTMPNFILVPFAWAPGRKNYKEPQIFKVLQPNWIPMDFESEISKVHDLSDCM